MYHKLKDQGVHGNHGRDGLSVYQCGHCPVHFRSRQVDVAILHELLESQFCSLLVLGVLVRVQLPLQVLEDLLSFLKRSISSAINLLHDRVHQRSGLLLRSLLLPFLGNSFSVFFRFPCLILFAFAWRAGSRPFCPLMPSVGILTSLLWRLGSRSTPPAKKSTSGLLSRAVLFLLLCVRFSLLLALCFSLLFRCPALLGFFLSLPRFLLLPLLVPFLSLNSLSSLRLCFLLRLAMQFLLLLFPNIFLLALPLSLSFFLLLLRCLLLLLLPLVVFFLSLSFFVNFVLFPFVLYPILLPGILLGSSLFTMGLALLFFLSLTALPLFFLLLIPAVWLSRHVRHLPVSSSIARTLWSWSMRPGISPVTSASSKVLKIRVSRLRIHFWLLGTKPKGVRGGGSSSVCCFF
mmetsp:Transcript_28799/g.59454  ORF Transcript_28799/g.59454 Transcript_28799/m.59454 type:complete len:404 (-) Transcript_28799:245-1456(-)